HELMSPGQSLQPAAYHPLVDLVQASLIAFQVQRDGAALGGAADVAILAHPDEGPEILRGHDVALLREELDRGLRQERLGDREHPVEVENHTTQMASFHFEVRAMVFDLDGVLVDTMPSIRAAWAAWAT